MLLWRGVPWRADVCLDTGGLSDRRVRREGCTVAGDTRQNQWFVATARQPVSYSGEETRPLEIHMHRLKCCPLLFKPRGLCVRSSTETGCLRALTHLPEVLNLPSVTHVPPSGVQTAAGVGRTLLALGHVLRPPLVGRTLVLGHAV